MNTFVELLISESLISQEALLRAIVEQTAGLPSHASLALESAILAPDELNQILLLQGKERLTFSQAYRQMLFWNEANELTLEQQVQKNAKPLSQILVAQGAISVEQLLQAFDRFQQTKKVDLSPSPVDAKPMPVELTLVPPPAETEVQIQAPVLVETPVETPIKTAVEPVAELIAAPQAETQSLDETPQTLHVLSREILPEKFFSDLRDLSTSFIQPEFKSDDNTRLTRNIFNSFYQLKGAFHFMGAPVFERLAGIFTSQFESLLQQGIELDLSQRTRHQALIHSALKLMEKCVASTTYTKVNEDEINWLASSLEKDFNQMNELHTTRKAASL